MAIILLQQLMKLFLLCPQNPLDRVFLQCLFYDSHISPEKKDPKPNACTVETKSLKNVCNCRLLFILLPFISYRSRK